MKKSTLLKFVATASLTLITATALASTTCYDSSSSTNPTLKKQTCTSTGIFSKSACSSKAKSYASSVGYDGVSSSSYSSDTCRFTIKKWA